MTDLERGELRLPEERPESQRLPLRRLRRPVLRRQRRARHRRRLRRGRLGAREVPRLPLRPGEVADHHERGGRHEPTGTRSRVPENENSRKVGKEFLIDRAYEY